MRLSFARIGRFPSSCPNPAKSAQSETVEFLSCNSLSAPQPWPRFGVVTGSTLSPYQLHYWVPLHVESRECVRERQCTREAILSISRSVFELAAALLLCSQFINFLRLFFLVPTGAHSILLQPHSLIHVTPFVQYLWRSILNSDSIVVGAGVVVPPWRCERLRQTQTHLPTFR